MTPTAPAEEPPAGASRFRGRHRKPRPRKALLAMGSLAVAASAVTLVRLAAVQGGGTDTGAEAGPRPVLHTDTGTPTGSPTTSEATGPAPEASPSSATALGGKNRTPLTAPEPSSPARTPTTAPDTASTPTTLPPTTRQPQQSTPAPPPPSAPATPPPAPRAPAPEQPGRPDPGPGGLCVPIIGLCAGGGPELGGRGQDEAEAPFRRVSSQGSTTPRPRTGRCHIGWSANR